MEKYDLVIIGAGPAGLSAAIYARRAGIETLILEHGRPGGQILTTTPVYKFEWPRNCIIDMLFESDQAQKSM